MPFWAKNVLTPVKLIGNFQVHLADGSAVRPEEHPAPRLRRPQRPHGHEHHQQGEERDALAWTTHQFRSGI